MSETIEWATATMARALRAEIAAGRVAAARAAVREVTEACGLCPECRAAFAPRRSDQVYCSERCRNRKSVRDMRRRKAAEQGGQP